MNRLLAITLCTILASPALAEDDLPFEVEELASFDQPWALTFVPDGRILVTEKRGTIQLIAQDGRTFGRIRNMPDVDYRGHGGLGDVVLHPDFENNGLVYLSYVEAGVGDTRGAAVARAVLTLTDRGGSLADLEVVWRQYPKMLGAGHYGYRLVFDDDGYLWVSSGDRQMFTPSQDMQSNIGKILRLHDDGSVPEDNPFVNYHEQDPLVDDIGVYGEIWSLGHRNPLGMATDLTGRIWITEMGPLHGDELNLIERSGNYGYPLVSNGNHYDEREIPDHDTRPDLNAPAAYWIPSIAPSDLMFYRGDLFGDWKGNALTGGLAARAIIRIEVDGSEAREVERYDMKFRIRAIEEGPEGALWVLEDEYRDSEGRLLKLTPKE